ncbi:MAG: hypothetical protein ABI760_08345 [Ferruginibacter sp.]
MTGSPGAIADENSSKANELTDITINKRADFFKGIFSSFFGKTKITVKSYSTKILLLKLVKTFSQNAL